MKREDDDAIIAAAREGFLDEARDMLAQFEAALLVMESAPDDRENLNAAFRAAHTIKGTAGLFGFDAVVAFTHDAETLLEALRSGALAVTEPIAAALLESRDQMGALLDEVASGRQSPEVAERGRLLAQRLRALQGNPAGPAAAPAAAKASDDACAVSAAGSGNTWLLSLHFGGDALRNGLDPLAFLRYLETHGRIADVLLHESAVPVLDELDAEHCHIALEVRFEGACSRADIDSVFEFASEDLSLIVVEPGAGPAQWQALLEQRRNENPQWAEALAQRLPQWGLGQAADSDPAGAGAPARPAAATATPSPDRAATPTLAAPEAASPTAQAQPPGIERRDAAADRRAGPAGRRAGDEARFVKVRADKLDKLIDLIGELVIAGSGAQMVATRERSSSFLEATQRVSELVQATRDGALALRMVPVGETFSRFQRVVRDVSKQLGKEIELVVTGGDTELDKSMVEVIADPLMHLVRNSLDHGLELPDERQAAGKPRTGRLGLNAFHEAGAIVIEVSDDGRGLRRDRILAKAIERGLVAPDAQLDDAEVWQLIFAPGFSTAETVTNLSGRGVGMDVVRRNIESLRGQIGLVSREGQGTTTQVRLPLTLAMIDGFLTLVAGVHYVLPLVVVSECIALPPEVRAANGRTAGTFDLRGEVLPWLDLARFYGTEPAESDATRRSLIVVRDGKVRIGLVVDRLLGEHQTVIKPLAGIFRHLKALAGSTILGSGDVALVLDMPGLLALATRDAAHCSI